MGDVYPQGGNVMVNLIVKIKVMKVQICVVRYFNITTFNLYLILEDFWPDIILEISILSFIFS